MEHSWDAILAHKESIRRVVEKILREGIEAGEFEPVEPAPTAGLMMQSMVHFCHPMLLAQALQHGEDLEAGMAKQIRFLLRAVTPRS
jgi:hypothetical protein